MNYVFMIFARILVSFSIIAPTIACAGGEEPINHEAKIIQTKYNISKTYKKATPRERFAANKVIEASGIFTVDDLKTSRVLSLNWFTRNGKKDVFMYISHEGKSFLTIVEALEDDSLQYLQYLPSDSSSITKISKGGTFFPDLQLYNSGSTHRYSWATSGRYELAH